MSKPDDDIDRLSREAAEHYQAPGQPAWDALQQILDKELPQEKEKKRRGFFFFFFLLLGLSVAGSGIWYIIKINNQNQSASLTDAGHLQKNKNSQPAAEKPAASTPIPGNNTPATAATPANIPANNDVTIATGKTGVPGNASKNDDKNTPLPVQRAGSKPSNTDKTVVVPGTVKKQNAAGFKNKSGDATDKDLPVADANTIKTDKAGNRTIAKSVTNPPAGNPAKNSADKDAEETVTGINKHTPVKGLPRTKRSNNNIASGAAITNNTKIKKNKNTSDRLAAKNEASLTAGEENQTDITANNTRADKINNDAVVPGKNDQQAAAMQDTMTGKITAAPNQPITNTEKKDSATTTKKKAKSKNETAINIGLTAGFDFSTVKFTDGDHAGYNIGLMGGYQFSKHWSVYTGLVYTKKNYQLNGKDYHPPQHYWTQYVDLQKVEGYCRMWEIPLLARYTFNPGAKTAFFASAGLSSYFMKKQAYDYAYKNNMNQQLTGSWYTDSTFSHVFSILHLSAGFEKRLGKHMNWQVEPYAKIPLAGVGFGNIRLSSFGVNFSVQYRHPVKR